MLNVPIRDERVSNASFKSPRSLLQYDIVVWNPSKILDGYGYSGSHNNAPCLDDHGSVAFRHDLQRRQREISDFLGLGRLLVILVPEPKRWYLATGKTRNEGTPAKPRLTNIVSEFQIQEALPVRVDLVRAQGEEFKLVAGAPFSTFWRAVREQFFFSAYLNESVGATLLTMSGTDRSVAALVEADGGTVLLLPQLLSFEVDDDEIQGEVGPEEYEAAWDAAEDQLAREYDQPLVDALLVLHNELVPAPEQALPEWASSYMLPGERRCST